LNQCLLDVSLVVVITDGVSTCRGVPVKKENVQEDRERGEGGENEHAEVGQTRTGEDDLTEGSSMGCRSSSLAK
jgi:hypothetical protein